MDCEQEHQDVAQAVAAHATHAHSFTIGGWLLPVTHFSCSHWYSDGGALGGRNVLFRVLFRVSMRASASSTSCLTFSASSVACLTASAVSSAFIV